MVERDPIAHDSPGGRKSPDPNATGGPAPLRGKTPGDHGRETQERAAALARGEQRAAQPAYSLCAPDLPGLNADLIYTLVAENVRDYAIFLIDADGIIRCWGEGARMMKWWTRQQAEGAHLRLLYPDGGSDDGTAEAHLESAARSGEYTGEGYRVRSDGSTFWAYTTLTALRNPEGELVGFTKVTRDFTARRAVEATLRTQAHDVAESKRVLEEAKRQQMLIASVSHELRAPLNALLGYLALLEEGIGGPERQPMHMQAVQRSARHLMEIANDVLDISRAQAGSLPITSSARRLGPVIHDAIAEIQGQAEARGIAVINAVSGGAGDLPYYGDEGRVRQILVNLLMNAVKFTTGGGRIKVSGGTGENVAGAGLTGPGPWVYARVEDTGRGIPAESLNSIFEPYRQSGDADHQEGSGLGLSISRRLARLMGGDVTVQSEVGVGSTFTLWLPIAPSDPIPR